MQALYWSLISWILAPASALPVNHTDDQVGAAIDAGTFQNPSVHVRPKFRYWVPDASIDLSRVRADIGDAARLGIGSIQLLGYYNYGDIEGGPGIIPTDWTKYGWGTPAWSKCLIHFIDRYRHLVDPFKTFINS